MYDDDDSARLWGVVPHDHRSSKPDILRRSHGSFFLIEILMPKILFFFSTTIDQRIYGFVLKFAGQQEASQTARIRLAGSFYSIEWAGVRFSID